MAWFAGYRPKMTPIRKQNSTESSTTRPFRWKEIEALAVIVEMICRMPQDTKMPRAQPIMQRTTASIRNCTRMVLRLAPMALRMPISRVRSVTVTSMMFMMPIPPTISEMAAMPPRRMFSRLLMLSMASSIIFWDEMAKASSSVAPVSVLRRISEV